MRPGKNLRMQNVFEISKSKNLINQTESYYNNPYLDEKMEVFLNHQIKVHFGNIKHLEKAWPAEEIISSF